MGKMMITQAIRERTVPLEFEYEDYGVISLMLKTGYTLADGDRKEKEITELYGDSPEGVAALAGFMFKSWNLADEKGDISLAADDIIERVPTALLGLIIKEAREFMRNGGLSKKKSG